MLMRLVKWEKTSTLGLAFFLRGAVWWGVFEANSTTVPVERLTEGSAGIAWPDHSPEGISALIFLGQVQLPGSQDCLGRAQKAGVGKSGTGFDLILNNLHYG